MHGVSSLDFFVCWTIIRSSNTGSRFQHSHNLLRKLYKTYYKTRKASQDVILRNVQVTHRELRKAEERKREAAENKTKKMADLGANLSISNLNVNSLI